MVKIITNLKAKFPVHHVVNTINGLCYGSFESKIAAEDKAEQMNSKLTLNGLILLDTEMVI